MLGRVKTTLDLPDDLLREIKLRAVHENRRIKDVAAEAIRRGLARSDAASDGARHRVELPLVACDRVRPDAEITPERAAAILLADEADAVAPAG